MASRRTRVVYSTDPSFAARCPRCGHEPCRCAPPQSPPPARQAVRIERERKGRAGKTVTLVRGLQLTRQDLATLAQRLREVCGSGGTVKDGTIELQGDHRERVAAELEQLGYRCKLAGG